MKIKSFFMTALLLSSTLFAQATYVNYSELFPGQVRYSSKNVQLKVDAACAHGDVIFDKEANCYYFKYYNGLSIFPEEEALPVIKAPFGWVLADGHHHTLAAIYLNAQWLPIKVIADYSNLSSEEFWDSAQKAGLVFLLDLNGCKRIPPASFSPKSFDELIDDSNRYFAAISARKCKENGDLKDSTGSDYPLWIKVGKDIPFIEFYISDALRNAGLVYSYEMGDNPPLEFVEAARKTLVEANIPGLRVVAKRTYYLDL